MSLNYSSYILEDGESVTLTATLLPANATVQTVSWSCNDPDALSITRAGSLSAVIAVQNGAEDGEYTVTCTHAEGFTQTCTITISNDSD